MPFETIHIEKIISAIETYVDINQSGASVVLTIGEALLVVINACETACLDRPIISALKILYLEGIKSTDDQAFITTINTYLADKKKFTTSADPILINADPTRRYFETHLAYHLLKSQSQLFDLNQLKTFTQHLQDNLWEATQNNPQTQAITQLI